jgi:ATP adenylyltransferase
MPTAGRSRTERVLAIMWSDTEMPMTPETLATRIARAEAHALSTGALLTVMMDTREIEDGGVAFQVTWLSSLAMKDLAAKLPRADDRSTTNPFLPFE